MKKTVLRKLSLLIAVAVSSVGFFSGSSLITNSPGGFNAGMTRAVGASDVSGGTLRLGSSSACDSIDPAQSFDSWCAVVTRMYTRNLMAFAGAPGEQGLVIAPDLATAPPEFNAEKTIWNFTLRDDVFWSDGSPVTASDVKYSILRLFDDSLQSPISFETLCLFSSCTKGIPDYKGPYVDPIADLASITVTDEFNLVFTLTRPYPEFSRLLATPQFAPINQARDVELRTAGLTYSSNPASNGPFVLTIDQSEIQYSFSRNQNWTQESDGIRIPKVDSITWQVFPDSDLTDQALLAGEIDLKLNFGLGPTMRDQVLLDSDQRKLVDNPEMSFVNFILVNPQIKPLDSVPCREAIFYALDKVDLQNVRGGSSTAAIAHSMSPPTVLGFDDSYDPYPSGSDETGNIKQARESLAQCGYPDGFQTKMAYAAIGIGKDIFLSVQKSLARVGIVVDPVEYANFAEYFSTGIGSPENLTGQSIGLAATGWGPDYSSPISYWAPIVDGRKIKTLDNQNFAEINSDEINNFLDQLEVSATPQEATRINRAIEVLVMRQAIYLPYALDRMVLYRPAQVSDVYVQLALGNQYDIVNVGLQGITP
jgi:peptide/nickel transport system substrate-binding protein